MFKEHPDDPLAFCTEIDPEQDEDDATYWVITYKYSTQVPAFAQGKPDGTNQTGSGGHPEVPQNPLDRKPKVRIAGKMFKRLTWRDLDDIPIVNKAGQPYEGTMLEVPRAVIHVSRNIEGFDYDIVNRCKGGVNDNVFLDWEARRVKCEELTAEENFEQGQYFWKVQGEFIVANQDDLMGNAVTSGYWWYEWKLNAGFEYLNASGALTPFDVRGQKPSRPMLLSATGTRLNNTGLWVAGGANPIYLGFRVLRDAPLNSLGLFD